MCIAHNCTESNGRYRCKNGLCISSDNVCNGFNDCDDGSDEDYSSPNGPCKRSPLLCEESEFKCTITHHCIPIDYVCDKDLDCGENDFSDEIGCYSNATLENHLDLSCENNSNVCEHNCTNFGSRNGFYCSCFHGFAMVKATATIINADDSLLLDKNSSTIQIRHSCEDINECLDYSSHCSQSCMNTKGSYQCQCVDDYYDMHGDGTVCKASGNEESIILIAHGSEIRQIRENKNNLDLIYNNLIESEFYILSIDVDPIERIIYWIDETAQMIKRSYIPNSNRALGFSQNLRGFKLPDLFSNLPLESDLSALAVDWIGKNIYYADAKRSSILVSTIDGRYKKTLINSHAEKVSSLVVNPLVG